MATDSFLIHKQYNDTSAPKSLTYQMQSPTNGQSKMPSISAVKAPTMFPTVEQITTTSNTPTKHPSIVTLETLPTDAIGLLQFALNFVFQNLITFQCRTIAK